MRTSSAIVVGLLWWVSFGVAFSLKGLPWASGLNLVTAGVGLALVGVGRLVRTEGQSRSLGVVTLGLWWLSLVAICVATGQSQATGQLYLLTLPLAAALVLDSRAGLLGCGAAVLGIAVVWLSELVLTAESLPTSATRFADHVGAVLLVAFFAVALRRTAEAERRQIEEERATAQAAVRSREHFLATMSHEVRTPLAGVLGTARLMLQGPLDEEQRERLHTIERSGRALMSLLDDALDLTSLRKGRVVLAPVPTDVDGLLRDLVGLFRSRLAEGVTLELKGSAGWRTVDGPRLQQIIGNLLSNATKFTRQGSVSVFVGTRGERLCVDVVDTGPGIDESEKVFQPFEQGSLSVGGTGLGLPIAAGLCSAMGGALTLQTVPGRGSTFSVMVEAPHCEPVADVSKVQQVGLRIPASVLVVEDNPVNMRICVEMLRLLGYSPATATSGEDALETLQDRAVDVVFMDVNMPGLGGLEVTRRVLMRRPDAWIVALTANVHATQQAACREAGMRDFVPKPFDLAALAGAFERFGASRSGAGGRPVSR